MVSTLPRSKDTMSRLPDPKNGQRAKVEVSTRGKGPVTLLLEEFVS